MKKSEKILMAHINRERMAQKGREVTDADYFKRWKKFYPDTFKSIIDAMEDYKQGIVPDFKRNPKQKY